jgi:hypothetical protein
MMKLVEGMRHGDLEDMVLQMISVDEYESKLDDSAIVIGFYVNDKDAADDLNRFIQKSAVELLDTEVSPAPDQHGYYMVFVELLNDIKIVDNIEAILAEVSALVADDKWQMQVYGIDKVLDFSRKVLKNRFDQLRHEPKNDDDERTENESRVVEFLENSDLSNALYENEHVELTSLCGNFRGLVVSMGSYEDVISRNGLENTAISMEFAHISECRVLSQMLGENWVPMRIGDYVLLQRHDTDDALLLRKPLFF